MTIPKLNTEDFMIALDQTKGLINIKSLFSEFDRNYQYFWIKLKRWKQCKVSAALAEKMDNYKAKHRFIRNAKRYEIPECYIDPVVKRLKKHGIIIGFNVPKKSDEFVYIPEENL